MKKLSKHQQRALATAVALGAFIAAPGQAATKAATGKPTAAQAERFVSQSEQRLEQAGIDAQRAEWVAENFITQDTEAITAKANEQLIGASGEIALDARRYNALKLPEATARKLMLLQQTINLPDAKDRANYARLAASMTGAYGKAKYCPVKADGTKAECMPLGELEKVLAESRDPAKLKEAWLG